MGKSHEAHTSTRVRIWGCECCTHGIGRYDQRSIGSGHESETCSVDHREGASRSNTADNATYSVSGQTNDMLGRPPTNEKGKVDSFSYDESGHKHNDVNLTMRRAR